MKHKEMALFWKKEVENGKDVVVYDFDGPRLDNGEVTCIEITIDKLKQILNTVSTANSNLFFIELFF